MKAELKMGSVNQIIKGTDIYEMGDVVTSIALVVKGRIQMHCHGLNRVVGSGSFLGIRDINRGAHGATYTAQTNAVIYVFPVSGSVQDVGNIMQINKDYGALMVTNLSKSVAEEIGIYEEFQNASEKAYRSMSHSYETCREMAAAQGIETREIPAIACLQPFDEPQILSREKLEYYQACSKIAPEIQKAFFSSSKAICVYHVKEQIGLLHQLNDYCIAHAQYLEKIVHPLIVDQQNLYSTIAQIAFSMQRMGVNNSSVLKELDESIDLINELENLLAQRADITLDIDRDYMEQTYFNLLSPGADSVISAVETADADLALVDGMMMDSSQLQNVLESILEFGELDAETASRFTDLIQQFQALPDKSSTEDDVRKLRRAICQDYYTIYKKVFWKDFHSTEDTPLEVDLFLRYGFISENLLSEELMDELLTLDATDNGTGGCKIYDMKEWLTAIAKGEREPSKNEFDMDYDEFLRDKLKNKEITPAQQETLKRDRERKLNFEIDNMFRVNHRLVSGQVSIFVPFLYTEGCASSLVRMFMAKDRIKAAVNRIRQIDFSAFYRESLFTKEVEGIKKEFIQQEVFPDIIIMPTAGSRGIMWQELSGRKRNTPGRFLLPAFLEGDLDKLMIYLVGCFRWELCRTMQGAHWNDIQMKSLTSEYSDFLQFYRKNKDLSDDKKEKVKLQIQKKRNNTREIFAADYDNWIRHEANGGIVLSKPVREIMATYCPFAAQLRQNVEEQPIFRDAMARFNRERSKKIKEYELKFRIWEKDRVQVPQEIIETRNFYTDF